MAQNNQADGEQRDYVRSLPRPEPGVTWVEIDGEVYGARPDERGPTGGGAGYANVVTGGDHRVASTFELIEALAQAQPGQVVFVDPAAAIDFTSRVAGDGFVLEVPGGITLASNRGEGGAPGAMLYCDHLKAQPFIRVTGPGARITGLRICGPDPKARDEWDYRCYGPEALGNDHYYSFPVSQGVWCEFDRLEVDNCEMSGWSHAAVLLRDGAGHRIHHSWMHHNQRQALGYHVSHNLAANSLIEHNLFDYARHAIAGSGRPGSGYEARHNVVLPSANGHAFDMHGGWDRRDGTDVAGSWMHVYQNTFTVTYAETNRPAVSVRGVPSEEALVHHNWFYHCRPGPETVRHYARTRVGTNLYGRPPRCWWVVAKLAWERAPSVATDDPAGSLALTLTNIGDIPANVYCPAIRLRPEEDATVNYMRGTARLAAGEARRMLLDVDYVGRIGAGAVELDFGRWPGGLLLLADRDRETATVRGRRLAVRPAVDGLDALDDALAAGELVAAPGARVRFVVAGDALALEADVVDCDICRTDEVWTGSCVEVFASDATTDEQVEHYLMVPADGDRPAQGFVACEGGPKPASGVQVRSEASGNGYTLQAVAPLECLSGPGRPEGLALELQVSCASAPGASRRHIGLFGAKDAYAGSRDYAWFDLVGGDAE